MSISGQSKAYDVNAQKIRVIQANILLAQDALDQLNKKLNKALDRRTKLYRRKLA